MTPEEFRRDPKWTELVDRVSAAQRRAELAAEAAVAHNYLGGSLEALNQAEAALKDAEQTQADHEETISTPGWGSW
jgi:hypothetical protein